jgi:hypothetical protein
MSKGLNIPSCLLLLAVLIAPGLFASYFLHSLYWIAIAPCGLIAVLLLVKAFEQKLKITPQQFAEQLEAHLL